MYREVASVSLSLSLFPVVSTPLSFVSRLSAVFSFLRYLHHLSLSLESHDRISMALWEDQRS